MMNLPTIDTSERLIHGSLLKCVDGRWSTQDNPEMTGRQLLALTTAKAIQRWKLNGAVETVVDTGTGLPDIDELNAQIPRAEWEAGLDGQPRASGSRSTWSICSTPPTHLCSLSLTGRSVRGFHGSG